MGVALEPVGCQKAEYPGGSSLILFVGNKRVGFQGVSYFSWFFLRVLLVRGATNAILASMALHFCMCHVTWVSVNSAVGVGHSDMYRMGTGVHFPAPGDRC